MTASTRATLSVVILTKNEEGRIGRCLESVGWADEILIVDGDSTDRTAEICRQAGARVIVHPFEGSFSQERNLGMQHARGEWVLQLDADDLVTPAFREAVLRLLSQPTNHAAFKFRRKSFLLGRFMRYGGWYHYIPNLVRRDAVRYEGLVHERPVVQGTIGELDADIEHHPCQGLRTFIARHNRYTSLCAQELLQTRGRLEDRRFRTLLLKKPWKTFWKIYLKKQGWREGWHGLIFAWFFTGVELMKWAKYWELCRTPESVPPWEQPRSDSSRPALSRPAGRRATIAIVMMTKHESRRLGACLDHVAGWADEIVIIDDCSTDETVEIARRYTDKIVIAPSDDNHDRQWNRGIERATADWILHIDADEVVTPQLREAIDRILVDDGSHAAFELMRLNVFLGHTMRYGGWYHRHLVLFKRAVSRCTGRGIHVQLRVDGPIGFLNEDLWHYPFASLTQFIERQNHYTSVEAGLRHQAYGAPSAKALRHQLGWRPVKLFWKSYRKHQGWREGLYGLAFALLFAFAHVMLWAKCWELTLSDDKLAEESLRFRECVHA